MKRKRDKNNLIVPTYTQLFLRLLRAADKLPPSRAAVVGCHWGRWEARQPSGRFSGWKEAAAIVDAAEPIPEDYDSVMAELGVSVK